MMLKDSVKDILSSGGSIECGFVTICYLPDYYKHGLGNRVWQVHSENHRCKFSDLYRDIDSAVDKFLGILKITRC